MRRLLLLLAACSMAAIPAQAELVRSSCSHEVLAEEHSCDLLYAGPIATVRGTAAPDENGRAQVTVKLVELITNGVVAQCTAATTDDTPATCEVTVNQEIAGLTPTVLNQSQGSNLTAECRGFGTGSGEFRCVSASP